MAPPRKQKGGSQASDAVEKLMSPASYTRMERLLSGGSGSASASATLNSVLEALTPQGVVSLHNVVSKPTLVGGGALRDVLGGFLSKKVSQLSDESVTNLGGILYGKTVQKGGAAAVKKALKEGEAAAPSPRRRSAPARGGAASDLSSHSAFLSADRFRAYIQPMAPPPPSHPNP